MDDDLFFLTIMKLLMKLKTNFLNCYFGAVLLFIYCIGICSNHQRTQETRTTPLESLLPNYFSKLRLLGIFAPTITGLKKPVRHRWSLYSQTIYRFTPKLFIGIMW